MFNFKKHQPAPAGEFWNFYGEISDIEKAAVVHTQPNCQPCKAALRWLHKNQVNHGMSQLTDKTRAQFRLDGHLSSPVVELWERHEYGWELVSIVSGFNPEKFKTFFE